jgi:hypothetical protein
MKSMMPKCCKKYCSTTKSYLRLAYLLQGLMTASFITIQWFPATKRARESISKMRRFISELQMLNRSTVSKHQIRQVYQQVDPPSIA